MLPLLLTLACSLQGTRSSGVAVSPDPVPEPTPASPADAPPVRDDDPIPGSAGTDVPDTDVPYTGPVPGDPDFDMVGADGPDSEPVYLDLSEWRQRAEVQGDHRTLTAVREPCTAILDRWYGLPPGPGGILEVASRRSVTVSGHDVEVLRTRVFASVEQELDVVSLHEADWHARLVLDGCTEELAAEALAGLRVTAWEPPDTPEDTD